MVVGHWLVSLDRYDYDLTVKGGVRFHHAMDEPEFRKAYAAGVKWDHSTYPVQLGPQPPLFIGGQNVVFNFTLNNFLMQVPLWHGFGKKDVARKPYFGRTDVEHNAVAPVWPAAVALAVLPVIRMLRTGRRRRRARSGCCPTCGYDLRATPEQCPECGSARKECENSRPAVE